jgi:effector-binding domain-containing protein
MKANTNALYRYLSDQTKWDKWWPNESKEGQTSINNPPALNNYSYRVTKKLYNVVEVETIKKAQVIAGKIIIIPIAEDSLIVQWRNTFATSINPFIRIQQYLEAINIKKNVAALLDSLKSFSENKQKVYGFPIHHTTLKDTALVAIKAVTPVYPSTTFIYNIVAELRAYIKSHNGKEANYPMLNVTKRDDFHYEVIIAVPTNKPLIGNQRIVSKRMIIYKDKLLTADVNGGPENIMRAHQALNDYMSDYNLISPVIKWESLITDRSKEKDSTKWVTKICIPIV